MKKNMLVISILLAVVLVALPVFLFYVFSNYSDTPKQSNMPDTIQDDINSFDEILGLENELTKIAETNGEIDEILGLENELTKIAETNGEISEERYAKIEKSLNDAEDQGYSKKKINYLRGILSNLIVGSFQNPQKTENEGETAGEKDVVIWHYNGIDWMPLGVPPECPSLIALQMPVDINLVTSVFYPGQVRGGKYKTHGGFRLDNSSNNIEVRAPFDGFLWRANRYIQNGELQYEFDVIHPCGIMYMLDHLRALSPKLMNVISKLPEASEYSMPTSITPLPVTKGEVLAAGVGMQNNVFMDFGVYDLRQKNDVVQDPYAVCGFDMLPLHDREKIQSLPASDDDAGKKSDYC